MQKHLHKPDTPRKMLDQVSEHHMAQSSWQIKLTFKGALL